MNGTKFDAVLSLISDELCQLILTINFASISPVLSLIGLGGHIINITVFVTQGFHDTVNISLVALAVSEMGMQLNSLTVAILNNPILLSSDILIEPQEFETSVAGFPIASFSKTTSWITAYITFERCLCVVAPLRVKRLITPKIVVFIMASIYVMMFAALIPEYMTFYLDWKYFPDRNKTLIGIVPRKHSQAARGITFTTNAFSEFLSFSLIILFTSILAAKLRQRSQWRVKTTPGAEISLKNIGKKDSKTIKMITAIAAIHILCFFPAIIALLISVNVPEFYIVGLYKNSFLIAFSFPNLFEGVNSSISVFLYYRMSAKYRRTINNVFLKRKTKQKI
ncbi:unnamed protein product [Lymnaea stagnalis]|uniref:G-protein coupled receptors family 1 profile domain-containing protein n=1 Tax=Lymnaea stagnalis TaxID=6523 RepID=A0AAV2IK32_LYMST